MTKYFDKGSVPHTRNTPVLGGKLAGTELSAKARKQWCWICDQEVRLLRHTGTLVGEDNELPVFAEARESILKELQKGPVRSISGFAHKVIYNKAMDHYRRRARLYQDEISVGDTAILEAAMPLDLEADDRAEQAQEYAAALLSCLSSAELTAFVLIELDGLSSEEAAVSINTANGLTEEDVTQAYQLAEAAKKRGERVTALKDAQGRRVMTALNARQTVHRARTKLQERASRMPIGIPVTD
ncbi:hypothetical protein ABZ383_14485 [Streptomyces sp. NPDC005900]|uniref:RNA polymerase sigma factor n=1 Tax=Streptomyces sp. NPDC005900 TaxID=3154569 RepID=UPI0033DAB365